MDYLSRFGPVSAGRLGEAVGLTSGALTIAVDRLEAAGYVRRRADQSDRRRVVVHLDKHANRVVTLYRNLGRATQRQLDDYSESELQLLTGFLAAASEALSNQATTVLQRSGSRSVAGGDSLAHRLKDSSDSGRRKSARVMPSG